MIEDIQDEELAKADLRNHERLCELRMPWEAAWEEIDERFPSGAGGFTRTTPGQLRGARNFDSTHINALERFAAAGVAITTPEESNYIQPRFPDEELMKLPEVKQWVAAAGRRLRDIRHALHTGFGVAANEDWSQLGTYGTSAVWQEATSRGLFYRTLHLSEVWIDVDYAGLVDTVHRCWKMTARQCEQFFRREAMTPRMLKALEEKKEHEEFEILHVVEPNRDWDADAMDHRRWPIASRYLARDEKLYLRRRGYNTMPVSVSRHTTSPGEIYGRSPAFAMMPNIQGANAMKRTTLRAAHKAIDPALMFSDDSNVRKLSTKPGGLNPGLVDEAGRPLVSRMPGGEGGIPFALEMIQQEQDTIRTGFLEEFYKILTDPNSRMTTTEVLEVMAKQGVLVRPYASRYATEKQHPMTQRDLDLALQARQIDPFPDVVVEAGAWPTIHYENPLAAMVRAESTAKSMRYMEAIVPLANVQQDVLDRIDADAMAKGMAEEIGVRPDYLRSDDEVAAIRAQRKEQEQAAINAQLLESTTQSVKNLAQAGSFEDAA